MKKHMLVIAALSGGLFTLSAIEKLVHIPYPDAARYNVNNNFSLGKSGWNTILANSNLKDHTMNEIAHHNNNTLYITPLIDLREKTIINNIPNFDSHYIYLMATGYDHLH